MHLFGFKILSSFSQGSWIAVLNPTIDGFLELLNTPLDRFAHLVSLLSSIPENNNPLVLAQLPSQGFCICFQLLVSLFELVSLVFQLLAGTREYLLCSGQEHRQSHGKKVEGRSQRLHPREKGKQTRFVLGILRRRLHEGRRVRGRENRSQTESCVGWIVAIGGCLLDDGFEFIDVEAVRRLGFRLCRPRLVPLLFHLENQSTEVLHFNANVAQDSAPELLPFHGQFHLFLDTPQLRSDGRPALQR